MNNTITCTRLLSVDVAHRIMLHESKCKYLHGHRYTIEATFAAASLDNLGRVVDFDEIRKRLGTWLDEHWDHTTILHEDDRMLGDAIAEQTGQTVYYLPYNPTAENLACYLVERICPSLFAENNLRCVSIRIQETPNCIAECKAA